VTEPAPPPSTDGNRRSRLDPDRRRAQIITAALELLEAEGVTAMTVEEIAEAAGVSRSLVYTYFGDRDSLIAEVYIRVAGEMDDETQGPAGSRILSDRDLLQTRITALLGYAQAHPGAWRLLVTDSVRRHPLVAKARAARVSRFTRGVTGGPSLVADAMLGMLEAGVLHWVERQDMPLDDAADLLTTTVWSGLTTVSDKPPPSTVGLREAAPPAD
jgi:AcrR family transcriptional regulator